MNQSNETRGRSTIITRHDIKEALAKLGLKHEDTLLVYGDLSADVHVVGGAQTILEALYEEVGYYTTIVMPAHQTGGRGPSFFNQDLEPEILEAEKAQGPAFDPESSAVGGGKLSQLFAQSRNTIRSNHPIASFLAKGRKADWFMSAHQLDSMFGFGSPLQKLYAQQAKVLCVNADYEAITALHLADYFKKTAPLKEHEAIISQNGKRSLISFQDRDFDASNFKELGAKFEKISAVAKAQAGQLSLAAFDYQALIDFAAKEQETA